MLNLIHLFKISFIFFSLGSTWSILRAEELSGPYANLLKKFDGGPINEQVIPEPKGSASLEQFEKIEDEFDEFLPKITFLESLTEKHLSTLNSFEKRLAPYKNLGIEEFEADLGIGDRVDQLLDTIYFVQETHKYQGHSLLAEIPIGASTIEIDGPMTRNVINWLRHIDFESYKKMYLDQVKNIESEKQVLANSKKPEEISLAKYQVKFLNEKLKRLFPDELNKIDGPNTVAYYRYLGLLSPYCMNSPDEGSIVDQLSEISGAALGIGVMQGLVIGSIVTSKCLACKAKRGARLLFRKTASMVLRNARNAEKLLRLSKRPLSTAIKNSSKTLKVFLDKLPKSKLFTKAIGGAFNIVTMVIPDNPLGEGEEIGFDVGRMRVIMNETKICSTAKLLSEDIKRKTR